MLTLNRLVFLVLIAAFALSLNSTVYASNQYSPAMTQIQDIKNTSTSLNDEQVKHPASMQASMGSNKCKCKTNCMHTKCTSNCSDCSQSITGLITVNVSYPTVLSAYTSFTPQAMYQESLMVQFRPPKSLHS